MILQSPGGGHGNALQYSCLEHPHGQRSLVGYIPWGHKELDMIEWISTASTISLLALYLDNSLIWKDICTPTFIAALFTTAKIWKQPKCPSISERLKKMCYICTVEYCVLSHSVMSDSRDPMDCSLPASSVHGILQVRILEWVAISFSRRSSWPRDWIQVSWIAGRVLTNWAMREALQWSVTHI